ncbi:MAG: hypothetical protein GKR91_03905 [Pseudomonadales bacterium]|nr:hypothetical protein [Pseudomonadales bacterium]
MKRLFLVILLTPFCLQAFGAAASDPLFAESEPLAITLTGPFDAINSARDREQEYDGSLSYVDSSGNEVMLDAAFSVRGNWRLQRGNCRYAQLWVDLRRSQLPGTLFENQNRLKLVVQCGRQNRYVDYLHKERQLYDIFSLVSDYYFDTRLLNVTYIDSEEEESRTNPAFFIEHQNRLSDRFQLAENELHKVPNLELNRPQSTLVSMFMYYIGNTDFSIIEGPTGEECCHNTKLLVSDDGEYFPIPYDFDASGFVDASYAPEPQPSFNLRSIRSRLYRGFCVDEGILQQAADKYRQAEAEIMAIVSDTTYVSERSSRRNVRYTEDFFEVLEDERDYERAFIRRCR